MPTKPRTTKQDILRWAYQHGNRNIGFIANVIQCHCGNQAKKLHGLKNLVDNGYEVGNGNTLFDIRIDSKQYDMSVLEQCATWNGLVATFGC